MALSPGQKKTAVWTGVVAVAAALLILPRFLGGGGDSREAGGGGKGGPGDKGSDTLTVTVAAVRQEVLEDKFQTTGTLLPWESVEVRAEVAGRITSLGFSEGAAVRQGQTLAVLDTDVLAAQQTAARTRRDLAAVQARRRRELFAIGGLAREQLDQAEAEVRVLDAELAQLGAEVGRRRVTAPFSGEVGLRSVSVGASVAPGDVIATLRSTDRLRLEFSVPERYVGQIESGDTVQFTVSGQDGPFAGRVYATEASVDAGTRAVTVRAEVRNPGRALVPGAFANVELVLSTVDDALLVPTSSVVTGADSTTVFVVRGDKAVPRAVQIGVRTAEAIQVTSGLAAGDTVLTSGLDEVRPGQVVRRGGSFDPSTVRPAARAPDAPEYQERPR